MGIGVLSPNQKLEVAGTIIGTAFEGDGSGLTDVAVDWGNVTNKSIVNSEIVDETIESGKIKDGEVKASDIGGDAVTSGKIKDGEIVNADVNASAAIAFS